MYQSLRVSRRWLAIALVLFGLPLFFGLRSLDLETDEAIYSFAVDRILEDGQWMQPKSSPSETAVFLEKPPLKFWIVAAPIRAGLLPHDEFGLRFWDALFGAIAFAYVFAIGCRLAGPVCGGVAVLALFVHRPLLFEHGLRTNSMEAPLFLAYCGGVYHFLEWGGLGATRRGRHAIAAGLYFVLGFLTKFVAALFLPAVLGLGALLVRPVRQRLWQERGRWLRVAGLSLVLIAPWFVYAQVVFGSLVWHTMLAEHVYARFTTGLNPEHVHPWSYYFTTMWTFFSAAGLQWLVPAGLATLLIQSVRRRWFEGTVVLLWSALPLTLISVGSSKLYHYAYPFLPPLALAVGYLFALAMMLAPVVVSRVSRAVEDGLARVAPGWRAVSGRDWVRRVSVTVVGMSAALAVWTLLVGQARLSIGSVVLFKSSGVLRPLVLILLVAVLARRSVRVAGLVVAITLASFLPIESYKGTFAVLKEQKHPLRDAADCIMRIEQQVAPGERPGLYVDTDSSMWHPIYYYFRRITPWTRQATASPAGLRETLYGPGIVKPSLVQERRYRDYLSGPEGDTFRREGAPPMLGLLEYALVLPGPYRACSPESSLRASD